MSSVRLASPADAEAILRIYAPIVRETAISFELDVPTVEQVHERISSTLEQFPWLVAESAGRVVGYAHASRHRHRAAYRWSVDVSAYVSDDARRQGIGRALYSRLLDLLTRMSYHTAFAGIALPNPASVALHESMGFRPIGVYRNVGYKLGAWRDVGWWQRDLRPHDDEPSPPLWLSDILANSRFES